MIYSAWHWAHISLFLVKIEVIFVLFCPNQSSDLSSYQCDLQLSAISVSWKTSMSQTIGRNFGQLLWVFIELKKVESASLEKDNWLSIDHELSSFLARQIPMLVWTEPPIQSVRIWRPVYWPDNSCIKKCYIYPSGGFQSNHLSLKMKLDSVWLTHCYTGSISR